METTFAKRLQKALEIREMKASELSERTGINRGTISAYISGKMEPKSMRVFEIASVLWVNEAWLLGFDVPMEKTIEDIARSEKEMINAFANLTANQKAAVKALIFTFAEQNRSAK